MQAVKPIYWHEGLFLRPQHFQQFDEYCHHSINTRLAYVNPYCWGVNKLSLVQSALSSGILEFAELDLIFSDGTHVSFPGNCKISRRNIADMWDGSGRSLSIYVALRKKEAGKTNVKSIDEYSAEAIHDSDRKDHTRYLVTDQGANVADYYANEKYHSVLFLNYGLQILVNSEASNTADYQVVKIAELTKVSGQIRCSPNYIPPVTRVAGSTRLKGLVRDCLEQVTSVTRKLAAYGLEATLGARDQGAGGLVQLLILQTLNRYVPLLQHSIHSEDAIPFSCYLQLRQLVAELSTFSRHDKHIIENMSGGQSRLAYNHYSLYPVFSKLIKQLSTLFAELISGPGIVIPLANDGTYISAKIDDPAALSGGQVYLAVKTDIGREKVVHLMECLVKISSREQLPLLISRAIGSGDLEFQTEPDIRLTRTKDIYYFKLNKSGLAWEAIKEDRNIALYVKAFPNVFEIDLAVLYD